MRAPSSFHSRTASPRALIASRRSAARVGEHRLHRAEESECITREPRLAFCQHRSGNHGEVAGEHHRPAEPVGGNCRGPGHGLQHDAFGAPWRTSPVRSASRKSCSAAVARASSSPSNWCRSAPERGPRSPFSAVNRASTSASDNAAVTAAGRAPAAVVQPMPRRPCRGQPTRKPMAMGISAPSSRASSPCAARSSRAAREWLPPPPKW